MLKSQTFTPAIGKRVRWAASASLETHFKHIQPNFEHGQWWVTIVGDTRLSGAQFSVVDAEGGNAVDGFDFECVTDPTELRG